LVRLPSPRLLVYARVFMKIEDKTRDELIREVTDLRRRVSDLENTGREHELTQVALKESEARYRSLVENIDVGITLISRDYEILMTNSFQGRIFGKQPSEFVGKRCFEEFEKRKVICPHCPGKIAMDTGQPVEMATEGVRDDGSRFPVRIQTFPLHGAEGEVTGFIEVVEDITGRKQVEEALRFTQSSVDGLAESAFWIGPDAGFIYINDAACRSLGYSREELLSMTVHDIAPDISPEEWADHWRKTREQGAVAFESRQRAKDGRIFPVDITVSFLEFEGKEYNCAFARDITERKRTEEELRQSEEKFKEVVELLPQPVFELDVWSKVTYASRKAFELFGYTDQDFERGVYAANLVVPGDRDRVFGNLQKILQGEHEDGKEYTALRKDGTTFPAFIHSVPIVRDDRIVGVRGIIVDFSARKETEEALRMSEERYRTLFETSRDAIVIVTREGEFIDVNKSFSDLFGFTKEEIMNMNARQLWADPDDRSRWLEKMKRHGSASDYEWKAVRKDGTVRYCLLTSTVRQAEDGTLQYQTIVRDVTEQRKAEQDLRESEERYRDLFENASDAIYTHDLDGNYTSVNKAVERLTGYSREQFLKLNFRDIVNPEDLVRTEENLRKKVEDGVPKTGPYEVRVRAQDGRNRWLEVTSRLVTKHGMPVGVQGSFRDVTNRKETEKALRRSQEEYKSLYEESKKREELYRSLLDSSPDAVVIYDIHGDVRYVNDSFTRIFGWTIEEVQGKRLAFVPDSERAVTMANVHRVLEGGKPLSQFEARRYTKDGRIVDTSISASRYHDHQGNPAGMVVVLADITERKQLEAQLRQAAKMEAIGQLAGGVAHDFNNLLTAMIGYCNMLMLELPDQGTHREKLVQINRAAERAASLTQQLLAFGRKQVLEMRTLDLNAVISDFGRMLRRLIGENVEIVMALDPSAGNVEADQGQIEQILMNLAVNARDAMPQGGLLTIETANVITDEEFAKTRPEIPPGDYVVFSVSDTGLGIDAEVLPRIFDPFFTTKEKGVGTGLGLSTVYGIAKQHRGHVTVYSELEPGTTFKVYLPRAKGAADKSSGPKSVQQRQSGTETVLVVEDEEIVCSLACEALEMLGYTTLSACDSREALAVSNGYDGIIHLLLTDVVLPYMDGRSLFERLSRSRPEMKVLYMSGYTDDAIVHHGVLDPDVHFLQKPFTMDSLAGKMREVLDNMQPESNAGDRQ
jgi:PAS domain S-box-containing protein